MKLKHTSQQPQVDYETARLRALRLLRLMSIPMPAAHVADSIWPNHQMRAQGAGGAATRILKRMAVEGLVYRSEERSLNDKFCSWGWRITKKGVELVEANIETKVPARKSYPRTH